MRSSRSIASRRLKIDAVESVTSLPKHSIKPGRTSPFFGLQIRGSWMKVSSGLHGSMSAPPLTSLTALKPGSRLP